MASRNIQKLLCTSAALRARSSVNRTLKLTAELLKRQRAGLTDVGAAPSLEGEKAKQEAGGAA
jgi:hypothetical protein